MSKIVCETCKIEIDVPEGYDAPFLRCPDCGAIQKYNKDTTGIPKFKVLDEKSREKVGKTVVGKNFKKPVIENKPIFTTKIENQNNSEQENPNDNPTPADSERSKLDSVDEETLQKAYKLASQYIGISSEKKRSNYRAKAIQTLMKDKYPLDLATRIIAYAEKSPEAQKYSSNNNTKIFFIIGVVIAVIIAVILLVSFM